jgi:hypothetical protein
MSQWMEWARMEKVEKVKKVPKIVRAMTTEQFVEHEPDCRKNLHTPSERICTCGLDGVRAAQWKGRRKFQVKVGSGTTKSVWVKGVVAEGFTVDFKIVGDPKWRRGVAYDVTWVPSSPFKLTMGGHPPK